MTSRGNSRSRRISDAEAPDDDVSVASLMPSALKAGFLMKRSEQGLIHNWKRRWMVLVGSPRSALFYFEENASLRPQGARMVKAWKTL
jgi:hypothetical protein